MIVCLSPGGQTTTITEYASDMLFVGTLGGIFSFTKKGDSWVLLDNLLPGKHIGALLFEPFSETVFVGIYAGAYEGAPSNGNDNCPLYACKDPMKGPWEKRSEGIDHQNLFALDFQKLGDRVRLYAGTEPAHLFFSDDEGRSWREIPSLRSVPSREKWTFPALPHLGHVKNITSHPTRPEVLYVAVEVGGLLKSTDGGKTWHELHGIHADVHRVLVTPSNPEKIYLSGLGGICVSQDGGASWENLTSSDFRISYPDALLLHPRQEKLLFMAGARTNPGRWRTTHTADAGIARSRDGGRSWEVLENGLPGQIRGNIEAMSMNVWGDGFALFAGTTDGEVFYSDDEGNHWKKIIDQLPPLSKVGHFRNLQTEN